MSLKLDENGLIPEEVHIDHHEYVAEKKKRDAIWEKRIESAITTSITAVAVALVFWLSGLVLDDVKGKDSERTNKTSTNR